MSSASSVSSSASSSASNSSNSRSAQTEFVAKLDKRDPIVYRAFDEFEKFYGHSFRRTTISSIIDGEHIAVKPDNIMISEPVDPSIVPVDLIDKCWEKFCTKTPYEYQRQAVYKIIEMEMLNERKDPTTGKTIVSNGIVLSLPIGAGKSLVFNFIALFFPKVKTHPIIVSTDGRSIPETEQVPFEMYPFYYENCAYIKEDANAVMAITTELERECTVILTYRHLLSQMKKYFAEDFTKDILRKKKIVYKDYHELKPDENINDIDVLVIVADEQNVNRLIEMSYQKPFARVVIDDYTNMNDLSRLRQILTFSFIPVSGSGFEKAINSIPSSYFSLKNVPSEKIKLVGDPAKTYEGVMRSNIMTGEIMTSKSDFDVYSFVSMIEDLIHRLPGCSNETPSSLFKEFEKASTIENFIKYGFFVQNIVSFKKMLPLLIQDISTGEADETKVSLFIDWYNNTKDEKFKTLLCTPNYGNSNIQSFPTLVSSPCVICKATKDKTYGFGVITSCCGAFICSKCINQAATRKIVNSFTAERMDVDDYYCVCCRDKHPRYYFNSTQHSAGRESRSYVFADQYFDNSECAGHYSIDYYFKMLKNGWEMKPECCCGAPINIYNDIKQGLISDAVFSERRIPKIEKIKNGDLVFPQVLVAIYNAYKEMGIKPVDNSILLIYKCKPILQQRMQQRFAEIQQQPDSPLAKVSLVFRDTVGSVIGLSMNIMGIAIYDSSNEEFFSMCQLLGRLLRISSFDQKILFYIDNNTSAYV